MSTTTVERGQIERGEARRFALAGHAIVTLVNTRTGGRFTFKIVKPSDEHPHFVRVLTGPDNEESYTFLGTIFNGTEYRHGRRSPIGEDAPSAKAFKWFWANADQLPDFVEVWHEGYCGRCGRLLTVPESVTRGIGPECWKRMGG